MDSPIAEEANPYLLSITAKTSNVYTHNLIDLRPHFLITFRANQTEIKQRKNCRQIPVQTNRTVRMQLHKFTAERRVS